MGRKGAMQKNHEGFVSPVQRIWGCNTGMKRMKWQEVRAREWLGGQDKMFESYFSQEINHLKGFIKVSLKIQIIF